ncbi:endonuclease domain-containing 1 protein-like [Misgurnus anguillicaudatus]|uniref:endonuclease domain-containing 1 protein-like n=1 Tax=Misgurnus anguillicaudatus TaxID=75329 RepID=UPI003CCF7011
MIHLLVMLSLLSGGSTEVVQNFQTECGDYFYKKVTPTVLNGPQYRQICQTLYDTHYYATLYDTNNKIPVYSAYKYTGSFKCDRLDKWYIEPQLENNNKGINMELWGKSVTLSNQASNEDYENTGYHKGHLAPVYHANSQGCSDATFTLTNAAPQNGSFNSGQWRKIENDMSSIAQRRCEASTAYIVTGVVPGNSNMKNRVRVPSHFWSAYCCKELKTNRLISGGVIGINSDDNLTPDQKSVKDLEDDLEGFYNVQSFILFDNNCRDAVHVEINRKRPVG